MKSFGHLLHFSIWVAAAIPRVENTKMLKLLLLLFRKLKLKIGIDKTNLSFVLIDF